MRHALCAVLVLVSFFARVTQAESEYDVKAAYLFKFTKFVEWPSSAFGGPDAPFIIGIVGRDQFGGLDHILEGKRTGEREFEVRGVSAGDAAGLRAWLSARTSAVMDPSGQAVTP